MIPSKKLELAIYKYIEGLGPIEVTVDLNLLSRATGEKDHAKIAERLTALDIGNRIQLTKWVAGSQAPRTQFRNDAEFYYSGSFKVKIAPGGRSYFEELDE